MENTTLECLGGTAARINYLSTGKQVNGDIRNIRQGLVLFDTCEGERLKIEIGGRTENICLEEYEIIFIRFPSAK